MRVRNPQTGTVVTIGEETATRYLAAGWKAADESPSTPDADTASKTRRRRTTSAESK